MNIGDSVRNVITGELGTVVHVWSDTASVRYASPRRGYSPQRDEWLTDLVPVQECELCGKRGQLFPDRGRRVCESCLMAGVADHAAYVLSESLVTVRAR